MPKMRLHIGNHTIIMRKILSIRIADRWFHKPEFKNPMEIQKEFYELIKDKGLYVQEIIYTEGEWTSHDHFLNGKRHCNWGPAVLKTKTNHPAEVEPVITLFYLNDQMILEKEDWKKEPEVIRGTRAKKLERVLKDESQSFKNS